MTVPSPSHVGSWSCGHSPSTPFPGRGERRSVGKDLVWGLERVHLMLEAELEQGTRSL